MTTGYLGGFAQGFGMAILLLTAVIAFLAHKFYTRLLEEIKNEGVNALYSVNITVERVGSMLYCYGEDGVFICQGADLSEIEKAFKERYPQHPTCILSIKGDKELIEEISCK